LVLNTVGALINTGLTLRTAGLAIGSEVYINVLSQRTNVFTTNRLVYVFVVINGSVIGLLACVTLV
jgi:hypothetical protein